MLKSKVIRFMKKIEKFKAGYYSNICENEQFEDMTRAETSSNVGRVLHAGSLYARQSLSVHSKFQ
jgi:hypothetical protein